MDVPHLFCVSWWMYVLFMYGLHSNAVVASTVHSRITGLWQTLVCGSTQSWFILILSLCWRQHTQEDNEKQDQSGQLVTKQWQEIRAAQIWSRWHNYFLDIDYRRSTEDYQHLHKHEIKEAVKAATSGTGWYGKSIYRKLVDPMHVTVPSTAAPITNFKSSAINYWCLVVLTSHIHHVIFVPYRQVPRHTRSPVQWYPVLPTGKLTGVLCSPPFSFFRLVADGLEL